MLGQIVLVRKKRSDAAQLQDALAAVQHRKLVPAQQFVAHLLERSAIAGAVATGIRGVEGVDGLLAQHLGQVFQGGRLTAAEENLAVHVAHDGIRIVLVDGFQLASCLQNKAGGNLTAADGRHQLFQIGNALLSEYPGAKQISEIHLTKLTNLLVTASKGRYGKDKAIQIRDAARTSIGSVMPAKSLELKHTIKLIRELTSEIDEIEVSIQKIMDRSSHNSWY